MTNTNTIKQVRNQLNAIKSTYHKANTEVDRRVAFRNATLMLVEKMGYKVWLASNLVELFFTQYVDICSSKVAMIQELQGDNAIEMFHNSLDELNYVNTWFKNVNNGARFTTNQYKSL